MAIVLIPDAPCIKTWSREICMQINCFVNCQPASQQPNQLAQFDVPEPQLC